MAGRSGTIHALADFFSPDYFRARDRFREVTEGAGGKLFSIALDAKGPAGEGLTIDIGWFGPAEPRRVLVHSSGIHGVEGFAGSAIQIKAIRGLMSLPPQTAVVLVHALNPYGMAHLRRVNESNVDLNRNFLSEPADKKTLERFERSHAAYARVDSFLNPPSPPRNDLYLMRAVLLILKHGMPALKQAAVGGQYRFPKGLFYGGKVSVKDGRLQTELEQVPRGYLAFLASRLANAEQILVVDVHTGLGKHGTDTLLVETQQERLRAAFGPRVSAPDPHASIAYHAWGSSASGVPAALSHADVLFMTQEFGTYTGIKVLGALRADNRFHHYGGKDSPQQPRQVLKETFCPADLSWRHAVVTRGEELIRDCLHHLESGI